MSCKNFLVLLSCFFLLFSCSKENKTNNYKVYSLNFDGIDDQLIVPNYEKLKINVGTIEAWFKVTKTDNKLWHAIIAKTLAYQITLREYRASTYDWTTKTYVVYGDTLNDGKWHHMAFSFQNGVDSGSQLYLDGKPIGLPMKYTFLDNGCELYVGGNLHDEQFFGGNIDEVRVWNKVRTAKEIFDNYSHEINPEEDGLVLYYKFNRSISKKNSKYFYADDETSNDLKGNLSKLTLIGDSSNYVSDTPVIPIENSVISVYVRKNFWLIFWIIILFGVLITAYKLRIKYIKKENIRLDNLVNQKTAELSRLLSQKDVLIQEIHHRVKNNLQFIISLIELELNKSNNQVLNSPLQNTSRRLMAMTLVHEMLYKHEDIEAISVNNYVHQLIEYFLEMSVHEKGSINFKIDVDDFFLNVSQCTSIGIIISELITNSIKHAFDDFSNAVIKISLKLDVNNEVNVVVSDNGRGIDANKGVNIGVGKKLIDVFCRQLNGLYEYKSNHGLIFVLKFKI